MCEKFSIARNTTVEFIVNKEHFTISDLQKEIINNGGILQVSSQQTIYDYLSSYEEKGYLEYSPINKTYSRLKQL